MFGERVAQVIEECGMTQRQMAAVLGFDESALAKWRSRGDVGPGPNLRTVIRVSSTLKLSMEWLLGLTDTWKWSPDLYTARERLWAQLADDDGPSGLTPGQRLVEVWHRLQRLLPDFREDVWAHYLRWSPDDWELCKTGHLLPGWAQFEGAEAVTGIPQRWFRDGDNNRLKPLSTAAYERAFRKMRAENLDPEDVIRLLKQNINPRL